MNEEKAIKAVRRVKNSVLIIDLIVFVLQCLFVAQDGIHSLINILIPEVAILTILNRLAYGVYVHKSRVCATILLASFLFIFTIMGVTRFYIIPLIICGIFVDIYYEGWKAIDYFHDDESTSIV